MEYGFIVKHKQSDYSKLFLLSNRRYKYHYDTKR